MSWKDNRRRKRVWYQHYKSLCDQLLAMINSKEPGSNVIAGEAIIKMFFDLYESRRMHKRRRVAESAWESFELAARDSGLDKVSLQPRVYGTNSPRPPARGEFGAASRGGVAPSIPPGYRLADGNTINFTMPPGLSPGVFVAAELKYPKDVYPTEIVDQVRAAVVREFERRADAAQRDEDDKAKEIPF